MSTQAPVGWTVSAKAIFYLTAMGLLAAAGACVEADSRQCAWGTVCPPGSMCSARYEGCVGEGVVTCSFGECTHPAHVCDETHRQCVFPIQRSQCDERAEGDPCAPPDTSEVHRCHDGVCLPPYCGDGTIDPGRGELCDDGGFEPGDGCSAACRVEAGWVCAGRKSACLPGPLQRGPAPAISVPIGGETVYGLVRTRSGALLVSSTGPGGAMDVFISRSTDQGANWTLANLGRAVLDTANARLWHVDEGTVAVVGQQTYEHYDIVMKLSTDAGATFDASWTNLSHSEHFWANASGSLIATPQGAWLASFQADTHIHTRRSPAVSDWSGLETTPVYVAEPRIGSALGRDATRIFLATMTPENIIETYVSTDDGVRFSLLSAIALERPAYARRFHYSTENDLLYLCATSNSAAMDDGTVTIFRSADHGRSWDGGTIYVSGLPQAPATDIACDVDDQGVYVAYQEPGDPFARLILPGEPVTCGNGSREPGEACDASDFGSASCLSLGFGGGQLRCSADCQLLDASGCRPAAVPVGCDFIGVPVDRVYEVDPDGEGPNPPFEVYCADMDTPHPGAYLSLGTTDASRNVSRYIHISPDTEATCRWSKVRFADLGSLLIDGSDQRFAVCDGAGTFAPGAWYGQASSCTLGDPSHMNIDLSATPFKVDLDGGVTWVVEGYLPDGAWWANAEGTVVDATGVGWCGVTLPAKPPGLRLAFR